MTVPATAARFAGRAGLVTGAASGLGREVSLRLAAEGARLVLFDREAVGLAQTQALCPGSVAALLNKAAIEQATFPIAGQFRAPAAWRAELRGVIDFGFPVVWNIERGR